MRKISSKFLMTCLVAFTLTAAACNNHAPQTRFSVTVTYGSGNGIYDLGSSVTITADAAPQYKEFDHWDSNGENISKDNPYTFTIDKNVSFTAMYKALQGTVTVKNGTGGGTFDLGSTAVITANIPEYSEFDHWEVSGKNVSTINPYTFIVTEDVTYTAICKTKTAELVVENGYGSGTYNLNSEVTVKSSPKGSQSFSHWEIDGETVSTEDPYTFTLSENTIIRAAFEKGVKKTNTDYSPIDVGSIDLTNGGTITVDYKYIDPVVDKNNTVSLLVGTDLENSFGEYVLSSNSLDKTHPGVTFTALDNGYNRLIICAKQLIEVPQGSAAPTSVTKILFKSFNATKGVYFDVKSEKIEDPSVNRGTFGKSGNYDSISFGESYIVSDGGTITVDYRFVDSSYEESNGLSMFLGSDDTHRFGAYKIFGTRLDKTYSGITFTTLDDGYRRLTVNISKLTNVRSGETAPTVISEVSFKWFEPKEGVYFDLNPKTPTIKATEFTMKDSDFKICNFTDVHITNASMLSDTGTTGKTIKYGIEKSQPDIMVFSGDIAGKSSDLSYIIPYLDSFCIPYFFILGNHDHDYLGFEALETALAKSEYGYIEKGPTTFGDHVGNYTVKINNSQDELVHSLFLMDTGNKRTITDDKNICYLKGSKVSGVSYGSFNDKATYCATYGENVVNDGISGDQLTWYEDTAKALDCPSSLFIHIGFSEYVKAYELYKTAMNNHDKAGIAACEPIGKCNMGEASCGSGEDTGIFDKIKEVGTKNVICGHDHVNDFSLLYDGVRLTYALKTGEGSYWKNDGTCNGYTELTVYSDGTTSLQQMYYNPLI